MLETWKPYAERTATVIGGRGALGSKIVAAMEPMGFKEVQVCGEGDPLLDFVKRSSDLYFAVDNREVTKMLEASRDYLRPDHSILDGSSVKEPLITTYRKLDNLQISVASTHLGSVPQQPWRGIKVWVCEVGPNSERAKRLAFDLFLSTNSSIQTIDISEHKNVEKDQFLTMATAHIFASALKNSNFTLEEFDLYATLNAELQTLPVARTLGQKIKIQSEILFNQPDKEEFIGSLEKGLEQLKAVLNDRDALESLMQQNIDFHNPNGTVDAIFKKAGVIGARNANLRMHSFTFRVTEDKPGLLSKLLVPFYDHRANLTAIDSMPSVATPEEIENGVNPDKVVEFAVGVDPKTIDPDKEKKIKDGLLALGCTV